MSIRSDPPAGFLPQGPFEAELRGLAAPGGEVACEMFLTRRDTFGPLHEFPREQPSCGPNDFRATGKAFREEYQQFPCGLASALVID